jgi:hypothetical protein
MKRACLLCVLTLAAACTEMPTAVPTSDSGPRHDTVCDKGGMTMGGGQVAPCSVTSG